MRCNHIILTTFPSHKSKNVGDNLITHSLIKMICARKQNFSPTIIFREKALDGFSEKKTQHIIAPGFSVSNNTYPDYFALYKNIERLKFFYPIGCSYQHIMPIKSSFTGNAYSPETLNFLRFITDKFGAFPCRDMLIVKMLNNFDIPAVYSGDLAIYDEKICGAKFIAKENINSIVFTIGHHLKYLEQSIKLLKLVKKEFAGRKLYISHHSRPNFISNAVAARAEELGFKVLHQYGDVSNLEKYEDIDLHIGYRLHGHIYFLRKRKPSVLMVEDARSFGFANTKGTHIGCFNALNRTTLEPDDSIPHEVINFLKYSKRKKFKNYINTFNFIDKTYNNFIVPYLNNLIKELDKI